jgi:hypothetical protein
MQIVTPQMVEDVAWDGQLTQANVSFRSATAPPRVSLGKPSVWAMDALKAQLGKDWVKPADAQRYALARFDFTLHKPDDERARYTNAALHVYLRPRDGAGQAFAFDLMPQRVLADDKRAIKFSLEPNLKFAVLGEAGVKAGIEIEHHNAFPVAQAYGLGEAHPYWQFQNHATAPLLGCQSVYLVVAASGAVRVSVELQAAVESRFGIVRLGTPEDARENLSWVIG